jgi:heme o synthase
MLGTLLVAGSASAANQWLERRLDARMARTASRPLPAGRLSSGEAIVFAAIGLVAGAVQLACFVNVASAAWALLTWALYVLAYTPLKTASPVNTAVGAVAGAMPVLIGWTAVGGELDRRALALFLMLFLWQFPHFMAIAWLYRREYGGAGYKMLTVVDPTGRRAGLQATIAALALVPVSIVPVLAAPGLGSVLYVAGASLLGAGQLVLAAMFWRRADDWRARLLLRASLVYLPTLLVMLMLAPWI